MADSRVTREMLKPARACVYGRVDKKIAARADRRAARAGGVGRISDERNVVLSIRIQRYVDCGSSSWQRGACASIGSLECAPRT